MGGPRPPPAFDHGGRAVANPPEEGRVVRANRRSTPVLAALVALAALGVCVAWAVGALASHTRAIAVASASAVFGRDVAIGRVSGTPWSGLAFEEVAIASAESGSPPVLAARRVTVFFDPWRLTRDILRRRSTGASIAHVILDEPVMRLERDPSGAWNVLELLARRGGPGPTAFTGRVIVLDGTVRFIDRERIAPRSFETRFVDVNGTLDFARSPRIALQGSFVEERGGRRVPGRVSGAYTTSTRMLDIDLAASGGDAGAWGPYILTTPTFRVTGGQFDVTMHILRGPSSHAWTTDYAGRITLREGRGVFPGQPASLTGIAGEIAVANLSFSSSRVRGALNGSPLEVRGEATFYGEPRFDVAVRSPGVDLTTIGRLFFPGVSHRITGVAKGEVRIVGPLAAPRIEGHIDAARGQIDRQPFERASGDITLFGKMMSLVGVRSESGRSRLTGAAWWTLDAPDLLLSVRFDNADAAAVRHWAPAELPAFDGHVDGSITALRTATGVSVAGQTSVAATHLRGVALDRVDAAFRSTPSGIALDHLLMRRGPSWAIARGQLGPGGAVALETNGGTGNLAQLPLPQGRGAVAGAADFAGRIGGTVDAPELAGTLLVGEGRAGGLSFDAASGRIAVRPGVLSVDGLVARSARARYRASGSVSWGDRPSLALDLEAERAPVETLSRIAGVPPTVTGLLNGRVRLEGPITWPSASGAVSLIRGAAFGQTIDEAAAAFQWDGTRLTVEGGSVRLRQSLAHFAGTFDRRTGLGIDVSARGFDLRDLSLPAIGATVDGHVDFTGRITGFPSSPGLAASAASSDLTINGRRFDQASGTVRWDARTLSLNPLALRLGGERYEIAGEIALSPASQVSLVATVTDGRLTTLLGLANARLGVPLDGTVSGTATVNGPLVNPVARLDLQFSRGYFGDHPLVAGHFDLTLRDRSVTIEDFELRPVRGRIAATGRYDLRGESQIEVSGADLDLDLLRPAFRFRRPLVGRLDFTMQLGGTLASPEVGFALEIARGGLQGGVAFDSFVANAFYRDGLLQIPQALLSQNGHKLRASGTVPFNPALLRFDAHSPLDFRLTLADVNLGLLSLVTDRVEEAAGAVEGEVRIGGTTAAPLLNGALRVSDGRLRFRGLQSPIEALRLDLRFEESAIRVAEGTARIGGGTARLQGTMRVVQESSRSFSLVAPRESPLVLAASDVRLVYPPVLDARVDGSVRLWGTVGDPLRPPTLDGRVTVSRGVIAVGSGSGGTALRPIPLAFEGLRLEAGRDLAVRFGGLQLGVRPEGSVVLTGTLEAPMLEGILEAERGTVRAFGNAFDLEEGTATFHPLQGLRPTIAARAQTQVGSARIVLTIQGIAPDGLALDLRSDPDLSRQEILALLGQQSGLSRALSGDLAGALRAEISRYLFGQATTVIGRALGLTELSVDYDFERPLALRAGARLLRNLYATATATFADRQNWLWALEYRFTRGWQLALRVDPDAHREVVVWYTTRF